MISIPDILNDCHFVICKKRDKTPLEDKWQTINNYSKTNPRLLEYLKNGYNYGVMPKNGICIFDADEVQELERLGVLEHFNDTFTVKSGGGNGEKEKYHYYIKCPEGLEEKRIVLHHPETGEHLGEIYPSGCSGQVVGPGSIHPSGNRYTIYRNLPIKTISPGIIAGITEKCVPKKKQPSINWKKYESHRDTLTERAGLRIEDIAYPIDGKGIGNGEIQGAHPVHGSKTGKNFSINIGKNLFHCWRCGSGGDPALFVAIKEGLIGCADAYPGALHDATIMKTLEDVILSGKYGVVYAENLRKAIEKEKQEWKEKQNKKQIKARDSVLTDLKNRDDTPLSISELNLTDIGNGLRFERLYGEKFRFDYSSNTWYYWNDEIWLLDNMGCAKKAAQYTIARMADEIKVLYKQGDHKFAETVFKHMKRSSSERARSDMLKTISPHLAVTPGIWNSKPNLLNLQNGTLNLETLKLQEFNREDYLTFKAGVKYAPGATCPEWLDHLNLVFGEDRELISAFQLMAGYSLLSGNPAQVFFIPYGSGKNGKSVTINTIRMVMGDYGIHIAPQSLMVQKNPDKARSDLVRIKYKRFVTSSEGAQGDRLDVGWIKQISGGEPIVARALYQNEIEFKVEAVIWFATNHKPIINEYNEAIWRRIWLIPFNRVIPEDKRIVDYEKKLVESEGSGILNWMIEGLNRYYTEGRLIQPEAIKTATDDYKTDEDPLGDFISDRCLTGDDKRILGRELYKDYDDWCSKNGIKYKMSKNAFTRNLTDHPEIKSERSNGKQYYVGIKLKTQADIKKEQKTVTKDVLEGFI